MKKIPLNIPIHKHPLLYLSILCVCLVCIWLFVKKDDRPVVLEAHYSIPRQIRYGFTLQNTTNRLLKRAELWTYAPVKQTSTQRCVRLETSHPYRLISDDLGNQILHFTLDSLPPYATKIITIKADLELSDTSNPITVENPLRFVHSERYIESDHPELSQFAEKFKDQQPAKTAKNAFQWVADHLKYTGYSPNERGALYALRNKQGDCTEFAYLFAALCRANRIPTRCIGGYIVKENSIIKPSTYHNWAEIYENGTWQPVDPQNRVFKEKPSQFVAMRIIGDTKGNPMGEHHRFRFEGEGLKVQMND